MWCWKWGMQARQPEIQTFKIKPHNQHHNYQYLRGRNGKQIVYLKKKKKNLFPLGKKKIYNETPTHYNLPETAQIKRTDHTKYL